MSYFRKKLSSNSLKERIIWTGLLFFLIFFGLMLFAYFFLPEGLLKNKNPLQGWNASSNVPVLTLQIFFYNLLSVLIILLAGLFSKKKTDEDNYLSVGYAAFFVLISINSLVLGTWSFSVESASPPLFDRIAGIFDLAHRAGLWEMAGQLLITCATAHMAIVLTSGKDTVTRKFREIRLSHSEKAALLLGLLFLLLGALIESLAISTLTAS